jgi:NAD(P)-dependent dehydrogenase (short-subunit alcohol dehydrogenase family)
LANTLNRVALITGGTRGIGQGIAKVLAADGYNLALNGVRDEAEVKPVLEKLEGLGVEVLYVQGDIGETSDREAILDGVQGYFGRLDILVNNAGVAPPSRADILEAEESSFNELMRVNCGGPFFLTQAAARWMIEQNETDAAYAGVIIFVTSISAVVASINRGDYCMSKAALSMAARLWAIRLAKHGIPVYELRPGIIETDMTAGVKEKYDRLIAEGLTLEPRWGSPEDIGRAVAALGRGELPYATGQVIVQDGGLTVSRL